MCLIPNILFFSCAEYCTSFYLSEPTTVQDTNLRCARVDGLSLYYYMIKFPFSQSPKVLSTGDCRLQLPLPRLGSSCILKSMLLLA